MTDYTQRGIESAEVDPDVQLMLRVREDDAVAFETLIRTYQPRILRVLQPLVRSETIAEDLTQDVFLRLWRSRKRYKPQAKFSTYIFHIAHNVASNAIRDNKRKREFQVVSSEGEKSAIFSLDQMAMASTGTMPIRKLDKVERIEMVRTAVEALNDRQRTALLLCKFEGLSYQEIAQTMDLSVQAVKSLLSRARINLKTLLEPYWEQGRIPGPESDREDQSEVADTIPDDLRALGGGTTDAN